MALKRTVMFTREGRDTLDAAQPRPAMTAYLGLVRREPPSRAPKVIDNHEDTPVAIRLWGGDAGRISTQGQGHQEAPWASPLAKTERGVAQMLWLFDCNTHPTRKDGARWFRHLPLRDTLVLILIPRALVRARPACAS
jgi:hypothetical protein